MSLALASPAGREKMRTSVTVRLIPGPRIGPRRPAFTSDAGVRFARRTGDEHAQEAKAQEATESGAGGTTRADGYSPVAIAGRRLLQAAP